MLTFTPGRPLRSARPSRSSNQGRSRPRKWRCSVPYFQICRRDLPLPGFPRRAPRPSWLRGRFSGGGLFRLNRSLGLLLCASGKYADEQQSSPAKSQESFSLLPPDLFSGSWNPLMVLLYRPSCEPNIQKIYKSLKDIDFLPKMCFFRNRLDGGDCHEKIRGPTFFCCAHTASCAHPIPPACLVPAAVAGAGALRRALRLRRLRAGHVRQAPAVGGSLPRIC